jgi:hypothetical protein
MSARHGPDGAGGGRNGALADRRVHSYCSGESDAAANGRPAAAIIGMTGRLLILEGPFSARWRTAEALLDWTHETYAGVMLPVSSKYTRYSCQTRAELARRLIHND